MKVEDIKTIAMYGAGTIGGGFAAYFSLKGLNVNVFVRSEGSIERSKPKVQEAIDTYVKYGIVANGDDIWSRIKFTTDPAEAFTGVYFVQENGPENVEEKHKMVAVMEQYLPEDAIIASSSSGTPVTLIAAEAKHPERIIVGHPFNPAYLLDGLGAINQPYVRFDFTHPSKPAVLTGMSAIGGEEDTSFRYLIMPIRFGA